MMIKSPLTLDVEQNYYLKKIPENTPSLLISAFYIGEKRSVFLKFYNPDDTQVYFWSEYFVNSDEKKHQPYCFVKENYASEAKAVVDKESNKFKIEKIKKQDDIDDKEI